MIRLSETDTVENVGIIREAGAVYDFRNHLNLFFEVDEQFEELDLLSVAINVQGAKDLIEELQAFVNQMEEEEREKDTYERDVYVSTVDGLCD
ncbi:hypothetical protein KAMFAM_119 [Bacillus phage Kamfam]|nr:hypothetical protein OTK52_117 [Bacillus phage OTooleKemple52]AXQ67207.1 hypothetical protein KAMFAM_119 [Bacillus phage Kamfam]